MRMFCKLRFRDGGAPSSIHDAIGMRVRIQAVCVGADRMGVRGDLVARERTIPRGVGMGGGATS